MGSFDVRWEESTLASVLSAAGIGEIQHEGDAGDSVYWLCYTIEGSKAQRIWVMAHGEMGGPEHAITNVTAELMKDARGSKDCPALPTKMQPVTLSQGLWLGVTENAALRVLGSPSHSEGPWRSFDHQSKVPGACQGGLDLSNWMLYKIRSGRVVTIMAGQTTSC